MLMLGAGLGGSGGGWRSEGNFFMQDTAGQLGVGKHLFSPCLICWLLFVLKIE